MIISALGALPKTSRSQFRLIHVVTQPEDVNDYASPDAFQYQSLHHAIDKINPIYYLAKVAMSQAYRVAKINPTNYCTTGIKYHFRDHERPITMVDTRLPFRASKSPYIFNQLT